MANPTLHQATLHFNATHEQRVNVHVETFSIDEAISAPFVVTIDFLSFDGELSFDETAGRGAAFVLRFPFRESRTWAGICSELTLLEAQHTTRAPRASTARYRMVLRPALWRLSLRSQHRIFQHRTTLEIVKSILAEWDIAIDTAESRIVEVHPRHECRVQVRETDLAFVSRLLEEAGISYWMRSSRGVLTEKARGSELSRLVVDDRPDQRRPVLPGDDHRLRFVHAPPPAARNEEVHLWALEATQRPIAGSVTLRDHDLRGRIDRVPSGSVRLGADPGGDARHERFIYAPGAAWNDLASPGTSATPIADDRGTARLDPGELERVPRRRLAEETARRTHVSFSTDALELDPGAVFSLGADDPAFEFNHPHSAFGPKRRLLALTRTIRGTREHATMTGTAACAATEYRPARSTPRPAIVGVQSAVVVGPPGDEIHVDELGRVRVQFDWDREGHFDDRSSPWIRVSQGWAGGGFGAVAFPRVGHEVLVSFVDGNPDQPIIVGRVFNAVTQTPYFPATGSDSRGANATKTAIRTDTSPHRGERAGYNELLFQDERDRELVHIQAQKDLSLVVNGAESHAVGNLSFSVGHDESHTVTHDVSFRVGGAEVHGVSRNLTYDVGGTHAHRVVGDLSVSVGGNETHGATGHVSFTSRGASMQVNEKLQLEANGAIECATGLFSVLVGGAALRMGNGQIQLHTGGASLTLAGDKAVLEAKGGVFIASGGALTLAAAGDTKVGGRDVAIDGGEVLLNCDSAPAVTLAIPAPPVLGNAPVVVRPPLALPVVHGGGHGETQLPPFLPEGTPSPPVAPGGFAEVVLHVEDVEGGS